jgi:uncharacterized damage-inducible protein DinB
VAAIRCPMCRVEHTRLGSVRPLRALRAGPARVARALRRVPRRLLSRRPGRGEWAVTEVMCHLADAEIALAFRIRKIAAEPGSVLVAWDQEVWTPGLRHRRADARQVLTAFTALRADTVALLRRLTPAPRRAAGRHPEYGRVRIGQFLEPWAEHDLLHREQIETTLEQLAAR